MQKDIKSEFIALKNKKIEEHVQQNFNKHWSRAIRYNLRCASVSASIPAMRSVKSFLSFQPMNDLQLLWFGFLCSKLKIRNAKHKYPTAHCRTAYLIWCKHQSTRFNKKLNKDKMLKGCGGGSDVCRSLAAYGTATKAEQLLNKVSKVQSPKTYHLFLLKQILLLLFPITFYIIPTCITERLNHKWFKICD